MKFYKYLKQKNMKIFVIKITLLILFISFNVLILNAANWQTVFDSTGMRFNSVKCIDSLNCYASANLKAYPFILKSSDGGKHWTVAFQHFVDYKNFYPILTSLTYPTKNVCIAVGDSGMVLRTTDNGNSWETNQLDGNPNLLFIAANSNMTGITVSNRQLFYTNNGGDTWQTTLNNPIETFSPSDSRYMQVAITENNRIIVKALTSIKGNKYKVFISEDYGGTWLSYDFPENCDGNFFFKDELNGWCVGGTPIPTDVYGRTTDKIITTSDGGKNWSVVVDDTVALPYFPLTDISLKNKNGIAVGTYGKLLISNDSGKTWKSDIENIIQSTSPLFLYSSFVGNNNVLTVTYTGQIYRYSDISGYTDVIEVLNNVIELLPNPANDYINIKSSQEINKIEIYSILGIRLAEYQYSNKIDISALPIGIYFLKINENSYKFIKY